ncbi:UNVERIFIED_CONTAM: hypothetical protein FKN15_019673 [Acipenser sinensis]
MEAAEDQTLLTDIARESGDWVEAASTNEKVVSETAAPRMKDGKELQAAAIEMEAAEDQTLLTDIARESGDWVEAASTNEKVVSETAAPRMKDGKELQAAAIEMEAAEDQTLLTDIARESGDWVEAASTNEKVVSETAAPRMKDGKELQAAAIEMEAAEDQTLLTDIARESGDWVEAASTNEKVVSETAAPRMKDGKELQAAAIEMEAAEDQTLLTDIARESGDWVEAASTNEKVVSETAAPRMKDGKELQAAAIEMEAAEDQTLLTDIARESGDWVEAASTNEKVVSETAAPRMKDGKELQAAAIEMEAAEDQTLLTDIARESGDWVEAASTNEKVVSETAAPRMKDGKELQAAAIEMEAAEDQTLLTDIARESGDWVEAASTNEKVVSETAAPRMKDGKELQAAAIEMEAAEDQTLLTDIARESGDWVEAASTNEKVVSETAAPRMKDGKELQAAAIEMEAAEDQTLLTDIARESGDWVEAASTNEKVVSETAAPRMKDGKELQAAAIEMEAAEDQTLLTDIARESGDWVEAASTNEKVVSETAAPRMKDGKELQAAAIEMEAAEDQTLLTDIARESGDWVEAASTNEKVVSETAAPRMKDGKELQAAAIEMEAAEDQTLLTDIARESGDWVEAASTNEKVVPYFITSI